jgi:hypothetical protein
MMHMCGYSQVFTRWTFLLACAVLSVGHLTAQTTEVQIMVNGSWDYVEDPSPGKDPNSAGQVLDRIVLVSPQHDTHGAFVFSGNNAAHFADKSVDESSGKSKIKLIPIYPQLASGIYYLDIENLLPKSGHQSTAKDLKPSNYINTQFVRVGKINEVLYNPKMPRVAVSLPEPDYYSTYTGKRGFSESKVDTKLIANQKRHKYTTWMVLHYWVNSIDGVVPSAGLTAILDDHSAYPPTNYTFKNDLGSSTPIGISVVMGAIKLDPDVSCDSFSLESFNMSSKLWGLTRYAKFPGEDLSGNQHAGVYHSECRLIPDNRAGGSADCHSAQMSINGIVGNSVP